MTNVFVPLLGEPLLYREKDGDGWKFSMKVGDGVRTPEELPDFNTSNPRPDWNQADETKEDYIKNKPNVKRGSTSTSVVIGTGSAVGENSVAGGTTDTSLVEQIVNSSLLENLPISIDESVAEGIMSIALGADAKAMSAGSLAVGVQSYAGCRGFYWWDIDFTNNIITLSTNQKPIILGSREWTDKAKTQLSNWAIDDKITIINDGNYTLCSVITAIDAEAGTITVDSLPFTEIVSQIVPLNDDYSVVNPSKPQYGVVELGFGARVYGVMNKAVGTLSYSEGKSNISAGDFSHTEGYENVAGYIAHAEGKNTEATGKYSHTEGHATEASGQNAHAEGSDCHANGTSSHAEGFECWAIAKYAHAENRGCIARGEAAHAEGDHTNAKGPSSHAEGRRTNATAKDSHAEGFNTTAMGISSHAEGYQTWVEGDYAHGEGRDVVVIGDYAHGEGQKTDARGDHQHVQGKYNIVDNSNEYAHIVGNGSSKGRSNAHTLDWFGNAWFQGEVKIGGVGQDDSEAKTLATTEYVDNAVANVGGSGETNQNAFSYVKVGSTTIAADSKTDTLTLVAGSNITLTPNASNDQITIAATTSGTATVPTATNTTAGIVTLNEIKSLASNQYVTAGARGLTTPIGEFATAEGFGNVASGEAAHAEGDHVEALGYSSHAEGSGTKASDFAAHAGGNETVAVNCQYVIGHYNYATDVSTSAFDHPGSGKGTTGTAFIIGNGTGNLVQGSAYTRAFRVDYDGRVYAQSSSLNTGADYAEYFEWQDGNPNAEDRRGYFVTLDGEQIKFAQPGDYVLGIISGLPSVIGNGDEDWRGRYIFDEFGAFIVEEFEYEEEVRDPETNETKIVTKIGTKYKENPDYDSSRKYVQRADRPEWDAVGMLGVLSVRDDGTCKVNGYCKVAEGGTATASDSGYRVIKRVNENIVKVIFR